jgi:septum formation protein
VEDHTLDLTASDLVVSFARGKAESLASSHPDALILGSDQVAEIDGMILTKPGTTEAAIEQLMVLQGRTHHLRTAVALHDARTGDTWLDSVETHMRMRSLTRALAAAYVAHDNPIDCAGSYKVEEAGAALFEAMEGADHTAIIGLPITAVSRLLRKAGEDLLARIVES